jgi:hypothetical protein
MSCAGHCSTNELFPGGPQMKKGAKWPEATRKSESWPGLGARQIRHAASIEWVTFGEQSRVIFSIVPKLKTALRFERYVFESLTRGQSCIR